MLRYKTSNTQSVRRYHSYKLASQMLSVVETNLVSKLQLYKSKADQHLSKQQFIGDFIKKTKNSPLLEEIERLEETLEACRNLNRLSKKAYDVASKIKSKQNVEIDEELLCFIELTNESYNALSKDMLKEIQQIQLIKSN